MGWIIFLVVVFAVYKFLNLAARNHMEKEMRSFFKDARLTIDSARGFLRGFKVNPVDEEKILRECLTEDGDRIDRKKLIVWTINYAENEKRGSGRTFLESLGYRSVDEIDY